MTDSPAADMTLKRSEILRRRRDLGRVIRAGTRIGGPALYLRFAPQPASSDNLPARRIAFLLSRQVGTAVVRNRAKRLLRETYRRHKDWFRPGYDYVLGAGPGVVGLSLEQIEEQTRSLTGRIAQDDISA